MNSLTFSIFDKISVESLNENKGYIILKLDTDKKKDIEKRLDLFNLEEFIVEIKYNKINKIDIKSFYKLFAKGKQKCVITLEPVNFIIKKEFYMSFIDSNKIDVKKLDDEYIEPIINNYINFGEIGIQMLSLFLDPYPKSNSKSFVSSDIDKSFEKNVFNNNNAFEVLNKIKK